MDWSTRRQMLRLYMRNHNWWWKLPFIATTVAVWVGALVLLVAPWDLAGSAEHVDGLPAPTTPDSKPDDGPADRVTSWSSRAEESRHGRTAGTALPTVKAQAESILPEVEPATADTDAIDREAEVAKAAGPLESRLGDVAETRDQQPRSSPSTTLPATTTDPATTTVPTTIGAPSSTSSPATTAAASRPTLDPPGPETSTTTTTQPAVAETTAAPTTTKVTGKPDKTDPTDDQEFPDTKNGKVPPGQKADKRKD